MDHINKKFIRYGGEIYQDIYPGQKNVILVNKEGYISYTKEYQQTCEQ